uniref:Uncharacterized protein n=1 Tax=Timema tahoe TaxID=61484 RepID=A0A7R9IEH2_9NEOP|nr:unnamed protein product [Timema tahoe]
MSLCRHIVLGRVEVHQTFGGPKQITGRREINVESDCTLCGQEINIESDCTLYRQDINVESDCTFYGQEINVESECTLCGQEINVESDCTSCGQQKCARFVNQLLEQQKCAQFVNQLLEQQKCARFVNQLLTSRSVQAFDQQKCARFVNQLLEQQKCARSLQLGYLQPGVCYVSEWLRLLCLYLLYIHDCVLKTGSETWTWTKRDLSSSQAAEIRRFLRGSENVTTRDRRRNEVIRNGLKVISLEETLKRKRLLWLGHVMRMEEERMPKKALRRVEEHRQDGWTKRRRAWRLKERTGEAWLREKLREINRNGRGCARRPADTEISMMMMIGLS